LAAQRQKQNPKSGEIETAERKDKRADYLTARQLSEVLQVSEATIHRLRRAGRIPAVLLTDRLIRFNLRDVQKALRPQLSSPASESGEAEPEEIPQLSFEDVFSDFSKVE
jgi:excisionase family DNA binding protein